MILSLVRLLNIYIFLMFGRIFEKYDTKSLEIEVTKIASIAPFLSLLA
jgi:hypothetical protein